MRVIKLRLKYNIHNKANKYNYNNYTSIHNKYNNIKIPINANKGTCNIEENCSNINNELLEDNEIEDEGDAEHEYNIENLLNVSSGPYWVK